MRFFDRIRNRTALFFCLAGLAPLLVLSAVVGRRVSSLVRQASAETDRALVTAVQGAIDERLSMFAEQCAAIALTPAVQSLDVERQARVLEEFLALNSVFFKLMVFDRSGVLRNVLWKSRYRGEQKAIGAPPADPRLAAALRRGMESGAAVWSEPGPDTFSQPVLYLVTPIRHFVHDDRVQAALVGAVSLTGHRIQELLDRTALPASAYACIVDDGGQILARKGSALPPTLEEHAMPLEVDGRPVPYRPPRAGPVSGTLALGGRRMLSTAARLPGVGLTLVVGRPQAEVMAPAEQAVRDVAVLCAIGLVLALGFAMWLSHSLVRPLLALVEGIRKVGAGELAHRVPVERADELGAAAGAFNEMAGELERQQLIEQLWSEEWREDPPPEAPR